MLKGSKTFPLNVFKCDKCEDEFEHVIGKFKSFLDACSTRLYSKMLTVDSSLLSNGKVLR